jgi:hypothetical protein
VPRLYLHIGCHKTGTTSIQEALSHSASELHKFNLLYPSIGKLTSRSGHHNLAWEIAGDSRFNAKFGQINRLFNGLPRDSNLILSSEDFSSAALKSPDRFNDFINRSRRAGYVVTFIVYIRNQINYLSSLYRQLIKHGLGIDFSVFCDEVLATGRFAWRDWIFTFCNLQLIDRLAQFDGADIVVRSYDHIEKSAIADFAQILGLGPDGIAKSNLWANPSASTLSTFRHFFRTRYGRDLVWSEKAVVKKVLANGSIEISRPARETISRRFSDTNRCVFERFNLAPFTNMGAAEIAGNSLPTMEDVFSDRMISFVVNSERQKK